MWEDVKRCRIFLNMKYVFYIYFVTKLWKAYIISGIVWKNFIPESESITYKKYLFFSCFSTGRESENHILYNAFLPEKSVDLKHLEGGKVHI